METAERQKLDDIIVKSKAAINPTKNPDDVVGELSNLADAYVRKGKSDSAIKSELKSLLSKNIGAGKIKEFFGGKNQETILNELVGSARSNADEPMGNAPSAPVVPTNIPKGGLN
jgi:hypothetical protein